MKSRPAGAFGEDEGADEASEVTVGRRTDWIYDKVPAACYRTNRISGQVSAALPVPR